MGGAAHGGAEELPENRDILEQISELKRKQNEAMAAIASLRQEPQRSYVYVPRERQITPFSGDYDKDGRLVDEFIEEVERVVHSRYQSANDGYDFVMSLLKGAALEEMRFRSGGGHYLLLICSSTSEKPSEIKDPLLSSYMTYTAENKKIVRIFLVTHMPCVRF